MYSIAVSFSDAAYFPLHPFYLTHFLIYFYFVYSKIKGAPPPAY